LRQEPTSTGKSAAASRTVSTFRCLNCFERNSPPPGAKTYQCPHCGYEWRVSWIAPDTPRIRGPVWEINRRLAEEETSQKQVTRE
jgi:predicted RNA-binding Zn-ribbon protein involved in translation (DUF1610 family)